MTNYTELVELLRSEDDHEAANAIEALVRERDELESYRSGGVAEAIRDMHRAVERQRDEAIAAQRKAEADAIDARAELDAMRECDLSDAVQTLDETTRAENEKLRRERDEALEILKSYQDYDYFGVPKSVDGDVLKENIGLKLRVAVMEALIRERCKHICPKRRDGEQLPLGYVYRHAPECLVVEAGL